MKILLLAVLACVMVGCERPIERTRIWLDKDGNIIGYSNQTGLTKQEVEELDRRQGLR